MNPYVIGGIVLAAIALIALAFYMLNKQSFAGAVGAKPPPARATDTDAADTDGATPTGG